MITVILSLIFIVVGLIALGMMRSGALPKLVSGIAGAVCLLIGTSLFVSTSYVNIGENNIATKTRVYGGQDLPTGKIIALGGQKGPQADIIGPGFKFIPGVNFIYNVDDRHTVLTIPEGKYGMLIAKDGRPLRDEQFIADKWPVDAEEKMLDATYFLTNGGQKGPQLNVLKPAKYRINPFLWDVQIFDSLDVPTGSVTVIRSNVQTASDAICEAGVDLSKLSTNVDSETEEALAVNTNAISTPIVPNGCIGVWAKPLLPGRYYMNVKAYIPTNIPTRLTTWKYMGGYEKRTITLNVDSKGNIEQKSDSNTVNMPDDAADEAVIIRSEGWEFPVEVRAVIQVSPENAPIVVATIGDLTKVENNIATPTIRDAMRTIGGNPERKVMDFVNNRDSIIGEAERKVALELAKTGVSLRELRLGEAAIPPELMVATLREQLADQLKSTYAKEQEAQTQRIEVEAERAKADQQHMLVTAQLERDAAEYQKERAKLQGEGERDRLIEIAKGQREQTNVLGAEFVANLRMAEMLVNAAVLNPDIVKVPLVSVTGSGSSLEGAAAVLGMSTLVNAMGGKALSLPPVLTPTK
jgi:hypothetical protein